MSTKAHYVTQGAAYDRLLVGKVLTDRTIAKRKKQGYFGDGHLALQRKEQVKRTRKKSAFKSLMKDFGL